MALDISGYRLAKRQAAIEAIPRVASKPIFVRWILRVRDRKRQVYYDLPGASQSFTVEKNEEVGMLADILDAVIRRVELDGVERVWKHLVAVQEPIDSVGIPAT